MLKRVSTFIAIVSMLVVFGVAQAQQPVASAELSGVLTAGQVGTQGIIMSEGRICNPRTMLC
jgi:hypothetical protein